MATATCNTMVDLRAAAPASRTAVALYASCLLRPGRAMEIVDDHDPADVHDEFQGKAERFEWRYLERGPRIWRVRILRHTPASADACPSPA